MVGEWQVRWWVNVWSSPPYLAGSPPRRPTILPFLSLPYSPTHPLPTSLLSPPTHGRQIPTTHPRYRERGSDIR
jgi:hypothetical protein